MSVAVRAGVLYFGLVFTVGFILGTLRVLVLLPMMGEALAVMLEMPVMLFISWSVAGWVIREYDVPAQAQARLVMGGAAFALLMLAEMGVGMLAFGLSLAAHFGKYATPVGLAGLAGQVVFGLMPWLRLRAGR